MVSDAPLQLGGTCRALRLLGTRRVFAESSPVRLTLQLNTDVDSGYRRLARLNAQGRLQTLHRDPRGEADIDEVVLDPVTRQPLIASYRSTVAKNYGLTRAGSRNGSLVFALDRYIARLNVLIVSFRRCRAWQTSRGNDCGAIQALAGWGDALLCIG